MQLKMFSATVIRRLGRLGLLRTLLIALCCALIGPVKAQNTDLSSKTELTLGVLASEGVTRALEAWAPTIELLNRAAEEQELPYQFRMEPHSDTSLITEMDAGAIDLFLTDPAGFVIAEVEEGARALMSVAHMWDGLTYDQTGALVFTRSDSDIRSFAQIAGRQVMGVAPNELTGWKLALQEARKYRLNPDTLMSDLVFSGGNQREVVYAVQNGLVDVGVIRAGVLETLAAQGAINLQDFRPVAPIAQQGYPFWVSTPLYPDWVMGALPDVPEDALGLVIGTLLDVDVTSPAAVAAGGVVWQAPQNYQPVHELLISLRARPYENYLWQAFARIYRAYKLPMLGLGAFIFLSILFLAIELRRNARLAEESRDVLKSEVRSKQFYRNAIEDHTVFCMLTKDGVISHVNERFVSALDRSRSSLVSSPLAAILNDANQELLKRQIMGAMAAGVPWQGALQLTKQNGKAAWVQCTFIPVTSSSDKLSEIAIVASDVTKTRAGVSETRFNDTLELIQDQVIVLHPKTLEILYANSAAEKRLINERMGGRWKGKTAESFITPDDFETLQMRCSALAAGPQRRVTWEVAAKNDVTYEISLEYAQPDQDSPRLIAIYRDVSERKVIEKAKNEFIATVSHELRTPLTSMKGALGLALSGAVGEMPEKMNGMINMAASSCDRLVTLINDILDLEKIEAGKMDYKKQIFDLDEMVTKALESSKFYADEHGVKIRRLDSKPGQSWLTYGDATRLTQVMDNLISNAAKFSEAGSEIHVSLSEVSGRLRIGIRDFGSGIPKKAQPTIFEKFTQADSSDTRSKGGTGLGLSIVRLIVEHHQGRISFVSEEGVGTEFFVDLPMVDGDTVAAIPNARRSIEQPSRFSDDPTVAAVPMAAEQVRQAVGDSLLEKMRASGLKVDLQMGAATAKQLASGETDAATPLAANWFGKEEREFLNTMLEDGTISDRELCLIEIEQPVDPDMSRSARGIEMAKMVDDWLAQCTEMLDIDAAPNLMAITDQPVLKSLLKDRGITAVSQAEHLKAHPDYAQADLVGQFGDKNDIDTLVLYPMENGQLPAEWPMVLIVSRITNAKTGQGVVSKFSSGGAARGRRRA